MTSSAKLPDGTGATVVSVPQRKWAKRGVKLTFVLLAAIASAVLIIGVNSYVNSKHVEKTPVAEVLRDARLALESGKQERIEASQRQIQDQPDYQKNPNYVLVLVEAAVEQGNAKDARSHLDQLKKVYNAKQGFSPELGIYSQLTIDKLTARVTSIENITREFGENPRSKVEPGAE